MKEQILMTKFKFEQQYAHFGDPFHTTTIILDILLASLSVNMTVFVGILVPGLILFQNSGSLHNLRNWLQSCTQIMMLPKHSFTICNRAKPPHS